MHALIRFINIFHYVTIYGQSPHKISTCHLESSSLSCSNGSNAPPSTRTFHASRIRDQPAHASHPHSPHSAHTHISLAVVPVRHISSTERQHTRLVHVTCIAKAAVSLSLWRIPPSCGILCRTRVDIARRQVHTESLRLRRAAET